MLELFRLCYRNRLNMSSQELSTQMDIMKAF